MTMRITMVAAVLVAFSWAIGQTQPAEVAITKMGAKGDSTTLNTVAIQKAIDVIAEEGGGTLVVPAGKFLTGAIFLKAGVNLRIEKDGVLLGSQNIDDYPSGSTRIEGHTQVWRPALVNADHCDGLNISGEGTIQGGGKVYWDAFNNRHKADSKTKNLDVDRPRNMFIRDSKNVVISGVSLRGSGFWNIHVYRCRDLTIEKLDIRTPVGAPSTDGIDVDSCQGVWIRGCYLSVDDDDIALKGSKGPGADHDDQSPAVENIHVSDCIFGHGQGAVTLGSEACDVKNVLVENCKMDDDDEAAKARSGNILVRLKLRPDTPQHYQDIHYRNITMHTHGELISIAPWTQYFDLKGQDAPTQLVEGVLIENITGTAAAFGKMSGPKKAILRGISFQDIDLTLNNPKVALEKIEDVKVENVKVNGEPISVPK